MAAPARCIWPCSDLACDGPTLEAIYQKRWNVEIFHKTLKSHAALAKSPTRRVRTQSNHCFMALYAAGRLEGLRVKHRLNHFALRSRLANDQNCVTSVRN